MVTVADEGTSMKPRPTYGGSIYARSRQLEREFERKLLRGIGIISGGITTWIEIQKPRDPTAQRLTLLVLDAADMPFKTAGTAI